MSIIQIYSAELMQGRILSETMVAGSIHYMELQRRCRIGVEEADKNYSNIFRKVFFELLQDKILCITFEGNVLLCQ